MSDFDGICSTDIIVLRTRTSLVLKYILLSQNFVEETTNLMKGISLPRIQVTDFLNLKVPIPSTSEQQQLVDKIGKIEKQISELDDELQKIPKLKGEILIKYLN